MTEELRADEQVPIGDTVPANPELAPIRVLETQEDVDEVWFALIGLAVKPEVQISVETDS